MKRAIVIHLEIPDEAPEAVTQHLLTSFKEVNEELAADAHQHFAGLIGIKVVGVFHNFDADDPNLYGWMLKTTDEYSPDKPDQG